MTVPGIASIVGELARPLPRLRPPETNAATAKERSSEGEFRGSFNFHGNGGYLSFHARGAKASCSRPRRRECATGRPATRLRHPSLFAYFLSELHFSGSAAQILDSEVRLPGRHTSFLGRGVGEPVSGFAVETVEWLPRHVAARRRVEVAKASGRDFVASSKAKYPESAKVRPPRPFSGSATFQRRGVHAKGRGVLTGPLYADIYGVKVRADAREGYAHSSTSIPVLRGGRSLRSLALVFGTSDERTRRQREAAASPEFIAIGRAARWRCRRRKRGLLGADGRSGEGPPDRGLPSAHGGPEARVVAAFAGDAGVHRGVADLHPEDEDRGRGAPAP